MRLEPVFFARGRPGMVCELLTAGALNAIHKPYPARPVDLFPGVICLICKKRSGFGFLKIRIFVSCLREFGV
jgi:hypothetical protein